MPQKKKQKQSTIAHHAKRLLVPHKGNNFRPHLIRWQGLSIVLALALIIQVGYGFATTGQFQVLGRASEIAITDLLADTNAQRTQAGLGELTLSSDLDRAAYNKAQDMLANNYWAHTSPQGVTPWKWLSDVGYDYNVAGENLAKNYPTAMATVNAWMDSPTHRANVLGDKYQEVGFAVVDGTMDGKPTTLVVAYYGEPAAVAAVSGAETAAPVTFEAPINSTSSTPLAYFGSAIQSLSPAAVGILGLLGIVGVVAAVAHHYRRKLPKAWQKTWRLHHGAYTLVGVAVFTVIIIAASGGGQI